MPEPTARELAIEMKWLRRMLSQQVRLQERLADQLAHRTEAAKAAANEWQQTFRDQSEGNITRLRDASAESRGRSSGIAVAWAVVAALVMMGIASIGLIFTIAAFAVGIYLRKGG